jgi:hypothetical protein
MGRAVEESINAVEQRGGKLEADRMKQFGVLKGVCLYCVRAFHVETTQHPAVSGVAHAGRPFRRSLTVRTQFQRWRIRP